MGIALIVPDISFADANLGKVTLSGLVPITGIAIVGPDSAVGASDAAEFVPSFTPINTTQRGVQWSVVSGSTYASINNSTGALTILPGASGASVTIRVTSSANNTIFAEKTISVTYSGGGFIPLEDLTARFYLNDSYFVTDITPQTGDWFKVKVDPRRDSLGAFFGSRKVSNTDEDSVIFERDKVGGAYHMSAKMYGSKYVSSLTMAKETRYVVEAKPSGVTSDPSVGTFTQTSYTFNQAHPIAIGGLLLENNTGYFKYLGFDFFGLEIYNSSNVLIHRLIPQSDLTILDEVTSRSYSVSGGTVVYTDD